ncbi:lipopolysaccharide biosynthesis protein [Mucilaginibacter sp. L3T2-6]|uniref:lipopolysaccharide biosynthesis protein n=1 Tax=Mucilaginibacter sp. L3T2-6 TaxID=3062491 RepID=UPI002676695D|nr:lipopolysaccharide biosynthesis protein [Mucilaginibacter sp. L3T2-6]MDO3642483.1 lipopolysaccharide biosynthesis protein [Mucilaginibacter sp. L3T2-6]MDV6215121.1 lipopolysaccharide biosynthesis protein [Mucilaginibacter sp. L3T2-6]
MVQTGKDSSDKIPLKQVLLRLVAWKRYLLSKWKIILVAGIVGGAFGLVYALLTKPVYKAELTFALEDDKSSGGGLGSALGLASQFGIDLGGGGGGAFAGDNLMELLKSRSMVETSLLTQVPASGKPQTLAELYISFNDLRNDWKNKPLLKNVKYPVNADRTRFSLQQDSLLGVFFRGIIKDNLVVDKVDKKLSILRVKVTSKNELFSKCFTEVLMKTVSDFYIATKTKRSAQNVNVLQRQTDSVRRELNSAILGVASSVDVNPNPNPALQILRVPSQRRQVDVQADQAILTQLVANLEISKVTLRKETPLIQVIDKPILPLEKKKTGKAIGIIVGGFLGGAVTLLFLIFKRLFGEILEN